MLGSHAAIERIVPSNLTIRNHDVDWDNDAHHHRGGAFVRGIPVTKNPGCKMNPIVQNMPKPLVSEEGLTAVENAAAARPKTSKFVVKSEQDIPPTHEENISDEWFLTAKDPTDKTTTGTKPSWKPSRDDRRSCRCMVPQARQSCELKVGANVLPASLIDESEGGFAVLIDCLDGLKSGKKVKLHTNMVWFTVRIVYVNKAAGPAHADPKCDSWFRLGLKKASSSFLL